MECPQHATKIFSTILNLHRISHYLHLLFLRRCLGDRRIYSSHPLSQTKSCQNQGIHFNDVKCKFSVQLDDKDKPRQNRRD